MEKFPEIKEGQIALVRVDPATGHILDDTFELYLHKPSQRVYTVFENLHEAIDYANHFLKKTNQFEFSIYDYKDNFIRCLSLHEGRENE